MDIKFHLALPCRDLGATRKFYRDVVGAKLGRHAENWLDVDLFGHQLTFTQCGAFNFDFKSYRLDGEVLPSFHFGAIVPLDLWNEVHTKICGLQPGVKPATVYLKDRPGEHLAFNFEDPNGFVVEFKTFRESRDIF